MNIMLNSNADGACLILEGAMTHRFSSQLEDRIIDSMRRYSQLRVDLSGVSEIDLCGIHLLGVLRSFGEDAVRIVNPSPVVEAALSKLPGSQRGSSGAQLQRERERSPLRQRGDVGK